MLAGDKVKARAFSANGESPEYSVEISIDSTEQGLPNNWAFKWPKKSTRPTPSFARVFVMKTATIEPVKGKNSLYAQKESGITRYEVQLDMKEDAGRACRWLLSKRNTYW